MSTTTASKPIPQKIYPEEIKILLERAARGDISALPELRKTFDEYPELAQKFGDLVEQAKLSLLDLVAGTNFVAWEAMSRAATGLRDRLVATANSEQERLLIDRIMISWMEVYYCDMDLASRLKKSPGDHLGNRAAQQRLDRAHFRYLSAVKALATLQKLLKPSPSAFDLLSRPVTETSKPWAGREQAAKIPVYN